AAPGGSACSADTGCRISLVCFERLQRVSDEDAPDDRSEMDHIRTDEICRQPVCRERSGNEREGSPDRSHKRSEKAGPDRVCLFQRTVFCKTQKAAYQACVLSPGDHLRVVCMYGRTTGGKSCRGCLHLS